MSWPKELEAARGRVLDEWSEEINNGGPPNLPAGVLDTLKMYDPKSYKALRHHDQQQAEALRALWKDAYVLAQAVDFMAKQIGILQDQLNAAEDA